MSSALEAGEKTEDDNPQCHDDKADDGQDVEYPARQDAEDSSIEEERAAFGTPQRDKCENIDGDLGLEMVTVRRPSC